MHIDIMDYYSGIKRNNIVPCAETWMDLETVIQCEASKEEKNNYSIILFICAV